MKRDLLTGKMVREKTGTSLGIYNKINQTGRVKPAMVEGRVNYYDEQGAYEIEVYGTLRSVDISLDDIDGLLKIDDPDRFYDAVDEFIDQRELEVLKRLRIARRNNKRWRKRNLRIKNK